MIHRLACAASVLLVALALSVSGGVVTGTFTRPDGAAYTNAVVFRPMSTPGVVGGSVVTTVPIQATATTNGVVTATLLAGRYQVSASGTTAFTIEVPEGTGTNDITDLVASGAPVLDTYGWTAIRVDTNGAVVLPTNFWSANSNSIAAISPPSYGKLDATNGVGRDLAITGGTNVDTQLLLQNQGITFDYGGVLGGPYVLAPSIAGNPELYESDGSTIASVASGLLNVKSAQTMFAPLTNGYVSLPSVSALPSPAMGEALIVPRTNSSGAGLIYLPSPSDPSVLAPAITALDIPTLGSYTNLVSANAITFPPDVGSPGQTIATDGAGSLSWVDAGGALGTYTNLAVVGGVEGLYDAPTNQTVLVTDAERGGLFEYHSERWQSKLGNLRDRTNGVEITSAGSGYAMAPMTVFIINRGTNYTITKEATIQFPHAVGGVAMKVHPLTYPNFSAPIIMLQITNTSTAVYTNSIIGIECPVVQSVTNTNATAVIGAYIPIQRSVSGGTKDPSSTNYTLGLINITAITNGTAVSACIDPKYSGTYSNLPGTFSPPWNLAGLQNSVSAGESAATFNASLPVGYYYPSDQGGYWARVIGPNDPINMRFLVGDTNDMQHQLQYGISLAQETKRELYFPAGDYRLATMFLRSNVTDLVMRGAQNAYIRIASLPQLQDVPAPGATVPRTRWTTYDSRRAIWFFNPSNVVVRGLRFTGPRSDESDSTNAPAIALCAQWGTGVDANDFTVDDCRFETIRHQAIVMKSQSVVGRGQRILRTHFYRCLKDPFQSGSALIGDISGSFEVSGCRFENCGNWGSYPAESHYHLLYGESANDARIVNNTFIANNNEDALDVCAGYPVISTNVLVANNTVIGYHQNTNRGWIYAQTQNLQLIGNNIDNARVFVGNGSALISGNTFRMKYHGSTAMPQGTWPLDVQGVSNGIVKAHIIGNRFEIYNVDSSMANASGYITNAPLGGLSWLYLTNSVVEGNTFVGVPVYISYSSDLRVRNNYSDLKMYTKNPLGSAHAWYIQESKDVEFTENKIDLAHAELWAVATYKHQGKWLAYGNSPSVGGVWINGVTTTRNAWQNLAPSQIPGPDMNNYIGTAELRHGAHQIVSGGESYIVTNLWDAATTNWISYYSTNASGGSLILQAGRGTGTGTNAIVLRTAPVLASGATLQTNQDRLMIDSVGRVWIHSGDMQLGGGTRIVSGSGSPSATGYVGSVYLRSDGAPNSAMYVNTGIGWRPVMTASEYDQSITAATNTIGCSGRITRLNVTGSYTMTSTPTIAAGNVGQVLVVTVFETAGTVVLQDAGTLAGSTLELGAATRTLTGDATIMLVWDGDKWKELGYSSN